MKSSDNIADLAAALAKAQAKVEGARKDSKNPHFKNSYADLSSVWEACRDALTSNGLSVIQSPGLTTDNKMEMTTRLLHQSGQWVEGTLSIPIGKLDPQGYGSATTYARRYALAAMVGVSPEDDDGNAASRPVRDADPAITDAQRAELMTLASSTGTDMKGFCTYYKIASLAELPASRFDHARAMLNKKLAASSEKEAA